MYCFSWYFWIAQNLANFLILNMALPVCCSTPGAWRSVVLHKATTAYLHSNSHSYRGDGMDDALVLFAAVL